MEFYWDLKWSKLSSHHFLIRPRRAQPFKSHLRNRKQVKFCWHLKRLKLPVPSSFLNFQRDRKFQSRNSNGRNISTYYFTRKEMTPLLAFLSHLKAIEMSNHVIDTFFASLKFFSSTTFLLKRNITRLSCYSVLSKSTLLTRTMF